MATTADPFDFNHPQVKRIIDRVLAIKRKITPQDCEQSKSVCQIAEWYANSYDGTFPFMVSLRNAMRQRGKLSYAQCAGSINCLVNDYQYKQEQASKARKFIMPDETLPDPPMRAKQWPNDALVPSADPKDDAEQWRRYYNNPEVVAPTVPNSVQAVCLDGTFTIVLNESGIYRTLRLATIDEDQLNGKPIGTQIASYLFGADNETSYKAFAYIFGDRVALFKDFKNNAELKQALDVLLKSDHETQIDLGAAYAIESGNCWRCGRKLTVPASISRGLGPICAEKLA